MSARVEIDYQEIATECKAVCGLAERQLAETDEMLQQLKREASSLLGEETAQLEADIRAEQKKLRDDIDAVRMKAESDARQGKVSAYEESEQALRRNEAIEAAAALRRQVDALAATKIVEFQGLLQTLLKESVAENYRRMREGGNGIVRVTAAVRELLDGISDAVLRQFTYLAYLQDSTLAGDELLAAGRWLSEETYQSRYEREVEKIRAELRAARVESEEIEKITARRENSAREALTAIREAASVEIVDETVRRRALKVIVQAIQTRGFIVDKRNIKIKRETNEVIMVALKASGERAEFRVFLDGRFVYHFHGYEGQACQRDIGPFMKDLEEVYGIRVTKQTEIWSNPDKVSTMKYQAINTNKNRR